MGLFGSGKKEKKSEQVTDATLTDGTVVQVSSKVDCLGDSCPRPQIMTKKALNAAASNEIVEIAIDNPTSMEALPPMCPQLASTHLDTVAADNGWYVYIQKN